MKTIWKYEIPIQDEVQVVMPKGANHLRADNQNGTLCIWSLVDPEAPLEMRYFRIVGTGHDIDTEYVQFIDTVVMSVFVWHVFEVISEQKNEDVSPTEASGE